MSPEEARLYLSLQDEDLEDVYESRIFEMQQFFLKQVPVSRLYRSKIQQMQRMEQAYSVLGGSVSVQKTKLPELDRAKSDAIYEAVLVYQSNLSKLKVAVVRTATFADLIHVSEALLNNMQHYAESIAIQDDLAQAVRVTQAQDEMEVLAAAKQLSAGTGAQKERIFELDADNALRKEANRLSLWLKMEQDDRAV